MALSASALAPLAAQMRMPASALYALPTAVEVFARKTSMSVERMIHECLNNAPLREYLAEICIQVTGEQGA